MAPRTRPVLWISAALKEFQAFPEGAKSVCLAALTIAAEGGKADIAKPMHRMGSGVLEIALAFRGDAYRVVYAARLADESGWFTRFRNNRPRASRRQSGKWI